MAIYSVSFDGRSKQALIEARSPRQALKWARETFGDLVEPFAVKRASDDDIEWVKAFGGRINDA